MKRRSKEDFIKEARIKNKKVEIMDDYTDSHTNMRVKCIHCGKVWYMPPYGILANRGCSDCMHTLRIKSNDLFLSQLKNKNEFIEPLEDYKKDNIKIKCKCKICSNEWYVKPNHLLNGRGCPKCKGIKNGDRCRKSHDQFLNDVYNLRNDLVVLGKYTKSSDKISCQCKTCGMIWNPSASSLLNYATRCPLCFASKGERKIGQWLLSNGISFEMHKTFDDLLSENGRHLNYDFKLVDKEILIEYQGEYHVKQNNETEEAYRKHIKNDDTKRRYAATNNYTLIEIWYWDFDNIENILLGKLEDF